MSVDSTAPQHRGRGHGGQAIHAARTIAAFLAEGVSSTSSPEFGRRLLLELGDGAAVERLHDFLAERYGRRSGC
jgi:hypothetical protein